MKRIIVETQVLDEEEGIGIIVGQEHYWGTGKPKIKGDYLVILRDYDYLNRHVMSWDGKAFKNIHDVYFDLEAVKAWHRIQPYQEEV